MTGVSLAGIERAAERIRGAVRCTPLIDGGELSREAGVEVRLKLESLQRTGSFKFRGASNAVSRIEPDHGARGVATHSSGNHALALAVAARARAFPCTVVMPHDAPRPKREAVERSGATIVTCEPTMASREAALAEVVARTGATVVPPFDHVDVIEGQGTMALEILDAWPEVDAVMAPIGGGGLIGGISVAAKGRKPGIAVLAAEPAAVDDAARSVASGVRQEPTNAPTLADGLRAGIGRITFPIVRECVDRVLTVSEPEIADWMRFAFERLKLVIEPSAAVGVAAIRSPAFKALAKSAGWRRVALVICGGNVDLSNLPWLATRA
jgi:threonine dehydratase/serine racemase